ncbi:MAG TPA: hypothetical protein VHU40_06835 [Polyangia bacterium]|nr:hypothetical protein [Polyangia bacterium]
MRAITMTRLSIAATALLVVAAAGCGDLQAIAQDILDHQKGGSSDGGTAVPPGCDLNGVHYAEGDKFIKGECSTCYCKGGTFNCTTSDCGTTPPPQSCEKIPDGSGALACRDYATWKTLGAQACAARGETLNDLVLGQACPNDPKSSTSATFVCCGPVPPSPPPLTKCVRLDGGGDVTSCKPSATWDQYGAEACAAMNLTLADIGYSSACSKTGSDYSNATYVCCAGPPPSSSPNGICGLEVNSDGSQCQSCWDAKGVMLSTSCAPLPGRK